MPRICHCLLLGLVLLHPLSGSITLTISSFSGSLSNLADSSNTGATNGMLWGILIDTTGTGFDGLSTPIDSTMVLSDGLELAPGKFFYASDTATLTIPGPGAGSGVAGTATGMSPYDTPQVAANQNFAIVWFDTGISLGSTLSYGSLFGIVTNPGLLLPADGGDVTFSSLFTDPDPIRPTDQTVNSIIPPSTTSSIVTVDPGGGDPTTQNIAFQFPVSVINDNSGTLTYTLWKSTDLSNWTVATTTPSTLSDDGTTRVLQLTDPDPIASDPPGRRFLRLEITP